MREREFRKLSVNRTGAFQLTQVKKEAARVEGAKLERSLGGDRFVKRFQVDALLDSRQRQVWRVGPFLAGDAKRGRGGIGIGSQCLQARGFDATPQDARRFRIREEAE